MLSPGQPTTPSSPANSGLLRGLSRAAGGRGASRRRPRPSPHRSHRLCLLPAAAPARRAETWLRRLGRRVALLWVAQSTRDGAQHCRCHPLPPGAFTFTFAPGPAREAAIPHGLQGLRNDLPGPAGSACARAGASPPWGRPTVLWPSVIKFQTLATVLNPETCACQDHGVLWRLVAVL